MAAPRIRFEKISKSFGLHQVVKDLSLDIERGEFVSLLGPSGSGKTTLLMMLAGFENPTAGGIFLDGRRIDRLPPHRREMGVVFQNYALFPHMSIADNIAFPLRMRGVGRGEIEERVKRALEMVQLSAM
ncbi:ATP-binding cassette domain-containing protein, partial [Rhizobium sp. Pop5]